MNNAKAPVSAYIICKNEEKNIRRCLTSLTWCEEIVVVDSGSTDNTVAICQEFTSKVVFREWTTYGEQKNYALSLCSCPWTLSVDADEEVSPELRASLETVSKDPHKEIDGYFVSRVMWFLGLWWSQGGWAPEYKLRFAKKGKMAWSLDSVHEKALLNGRKEKLAGALFHYSYLDLADQLNRLNHYTNLAARGVRENQSIKQWQLLLYLLTRPIARFVKFYILRRGFIYGTAGLITAVVEAFSVFLKYAKQWEATKIDRTGIDGVREGCGIENRQVQATGDRGNCL